MKMSPHSPKSDSTHPELPRKILIVDDDVLSIATLTQILLQNGYEVLHAEDGDHAVTIAQKSRPDMIICNAESKTVDVIEFLKSVHEAPQTRGAAILILTDNRYMLAGQPVLLGPKRYLMKPYTREQLAIAVQENLKQSGNKKLERS
jgi:PleD family two-component response regulator